MCRISPGGTSTWLAVAAGKAGQRATSASITEAVSTEVETPFGQQAQSRQRPAHSLKGSSHPVEHAAERPKTAAPIHANRRKAPKIAPKRLTAGFMLPDPQSSRQSESSTAAQTTARRSRSAFAITDTELKLIAAAAITGDRSIPKNG
jgi:hypothetical protein